MSKQTYMVGFCKKAAEYNVNPRELASFVLSKEAQSSVWDSVKEYLDKAKDATMSAARATGQWYNVQPNVVKALVGAGLGSAAGVGLGAAVGGKKGLAPGAIIGALGGAGATQVNWGALSEYFGNMMKKNEEKKDTKATDATVVQPVVDEDGSPADVEHS